MKSLLLSLIAVTTALSTTSATAQNAVWEKKLQKAMPVFGHRNWIVIADSAYPSQTAPGIATIYTGGKQLDVVRKVLAAVDKAKHVRGVVFIDAELPYVPEKSAKGIGQYRNELGRILKGRKPTSLPHGKIIEKLDDAGKSFHVLILKTDLTLPYTSVFIRLDAGYWSDEAEAELRKAMKAAGVGTSHRIETRQ